MTMNTVASQDLKATLESNVVTVQFTKVDGTPRTLIGTRIESVIAARENLSEADLAERKARQTSEPSDKIAVWDLEIDEWRSFHDSQVVSAEVMPDYPV